MTMPAQKPGRSKQDYATPRAFLDAVKRRLRIEEFGWDLAASAENSVSPWGFYSEVDDSLIQPWVTQPPDWMWLNPPYADIKPWAVKCAVTKALGRRVAFLVPASVGADWFRDHVHGQALVLALNGRLAFMPDKPRWLYPKDCILALYSPAIEPGFEVWNWRK